MGEVRNHSKVLDEIGYEVSIDLLGLWRMQLNEAENEVNASNVEITNFSATGCRAMKGKKEEKRPHYISIPSR